MFNAMRASANSIINRVMSNANGIGESKREARAKSQIKGENGHKVSDKAHSIKEVQNLRSTTTQYINYIKENCTGKLSLNINAQSAKSFIISKLEDGSWKGSSANTNISNLNKIVDNLNKDNIGLLTRSDIKKIKTEIKQDYNLSKVHINRAYMNPNIIVEAMKYTIMAISATLQHEAGLRSDDAINSNKWTINKDNTITISGSKGGIHYTTKPLKTETIQRAIEAKKMSYKANYSEYREALKNAVEQTNQRWSGTHGLRYNFTQERIEELKNHDYADDEAKGQTSLEMGHSRLDIVYNYL